MPPVAESAIVPGGEARHRRYGPLIEDERCDFILDLEPRLVCVQRRWAPHFRDVVLPYELFAGRRQICLRLEPSKNARQRGVNWASAFEFGATLRRLRGP